MKVSNKWKNSLYALIAFFVIAILSFKGFLIHLDSEILFNAGDPVLNLYFLKWGADYLLHGFLHANSIFNLPIAFPFQNSLSLSDNLFGNQLLFLPIYALTNKPLFAYNVWILLTVFLNYMAMYSYIRNSKFINAEADLAVVGAMVFAFSLPSINLLGGHFQLLPLYAIPLTMYCLEKSMLTLRIRWFFLLGLSSAFQFYLGIQTGFILAMLLLIIAPIYFYYMVDKKLQYIGSLSCSLIVFLMLVALLMYPYYEASLLFDPRTYNDLDYFSPSYKDFFNDNFSEKGVYVGISTLLMLVVSTVFVKGSRAKWLLAAILFSYLFMFKETYIFILFSDYIPGFTSIRTPGRFVFVSIFLISIFVSMSLSTSLSTVAIGIRHKVIGVFLLGIMIGAFVNKIPVHKYDYNTDYYPTELIEKIDGKPTLLIPFYDGGTLDNIYLMIARMVAVDGRFPILGLYSGNNPQFVDSVISQYRNTDGDPRVFLDRVLRLGFQVVVLDKSKAINTQVKSYLDLANEHSVVKAYEDEKYIMYNIANTEKRTHLQNSDELDKVVFTKPSMVVSNKGQFVYSIVNLISSDMSGVVQKKQTINAFTLYDGINYPCYLQMNEVKDAFSKYECTAAPLGFQKRRDSDNGVNNAHVSLTASSLPSISKVNSGHSVNVTVKNLSTTPLYFEGRYPTSFSYKIYSAKGRELFLGGEGTDGTAVRTKLYGTLKSNDLLTTKMQVRTPYKPGDYTVEIDLVQDGYTWFKQKGITTIRQKIHVE